MPPPLIIVVVTLMLVIVVVEMVTVVVPFMLILVSLFTRIAWTQLAVLENFEQGTVITVYN